MNILELYDLAAENNIQIDHRRIKTMIAFSIPGSIAIDLSQLQTLAETKVCLSHELGHEFKNAFYNLRNTFETRERQEERANRWAIHNLLPVSDLKCAVESGITEVWELAEHFDVTEDFIRDALRLYTMEGSLETAN